jgi:hypothetical protein
MPEYDVAVFPRFWTARPVAEPPVLVNFTWSASTELVVPIPTVPPTSYTAELATVSLSMYLAR